jgi:hypothetical protein
MLKKQEYSKLLYCKNQVGTGYYTTKKQRNCICITELIKLEPINFIIRI